MKHGFISVACGAPKLRLADCHYNAEQTFTMMRDADKRGVKVLVLPEMSLTGYTCGDLFNQSSLIRGAEEALATILEGELGAPVFIENDSRSMTYGEYLSGVCNNERNVRNHDENSTYRYCESNR